MVKYMQSLHSQGRMVRVTTRRGRLNGTCDWIMNIFGSWGYGNWAIGLYEVDWVYPRGLYRRELGETCDGMKTMDEEYKYIVDCTVKFQNTKFHSFAHSSILHSFIHYFIVSFSSHSILYKPTFHQQLYLSNHSLTFNSTPIFTDSKPTMRITTVAGLIVGGLSLSQALVLPPTS